MKPGGTDDDEERRRMCCKGFPHSQLTHNLKIKIPPHAHALNETFYDWVLNC